MFTGYIYLLHLVDVRSEIEIVHIHLYIRQNAEKLELAAL